MKTGSRKDRTRKFIELALLLACFYFPGFVNAESGFQIVGYMLQYVLFSVPQTLLIVYIIWIQPSPPLEEFGFTSLKAADAVYTAFLLVGVFCLFLLLSLAVTVLPQGVQDDLLKGWRWKLPSLSTLPLALIFSMTTGYREEIFFRSYLITRFRDLAVPALPAALAASFLFALGHYYQGWIGVIFTFAQGLAFSIFFLKRKNVHVLAIAHGVYNFTVLAIGVLSP